jgi:ribonucleoside-diphosphate reductase alpha chain
MTSHEPTRQRLPRSRSGVTYSVEVANADVFATTNTYADGRLGEVFAKWGKAGSTTVGMMDAFSIMLSIALQYGAPLDVIVSKLKDMRFEPAGFTDDPDIPHACSVMDWLARRLALDFLTAEQRADLGIFSVDEEARGLTADQSAAVTG